MPDIWYFWPLPLIFHMRLNFLSGGSKSVKIFHFVLNLLCGCSKCVLICSVYVLNVAGAVLFRFWIKIEKTIHLNLCSEPKQTSSSNFQDANRTLMHEIKQPIRKRLSESELFQDANRAVWTRLEQPQIKCETNRKFEHFLSLCIRT
jgi:hypothetical protein